MITPQPTTPIDAAGRHLRCPSCATPLKPTRKQGRPRKICSSPQCRRAWVNAKRGLRELQLGVFCIHCREPLTVPHKRGCPGGARGSPK
jgi:hypothetical protein